MSNKIKNKTPKTLGFSFPAEWHPHESTWLSFPHNLETWENRLHRVYKGYLKFILELAENETVNIIAKDKEHSRLIKKLLIDNKIESNYPINIFPFGTNDSWCRDHGPSFVINKDKKAIVNWGYNAWGEKYPPFNLDNEVPINIANHLNLDIFEPNLIMEGGSVEFNGAGTILTSKSCLLNKNRNATYNQSEIESILCDFYGQEQVLWVSGGIEGDDTDGHIDDFMRFTSKNRVLAATESNKKDPNSVILEKNIIELKKQKLIDGSSLEIIELPMPSPLIDNGIRLPASYANFYIANNKVIVPVFKDKNDDKALSIIQNEFKDRKVVGIDSREIVWGLGSFHCLSQQEPKNNANEISL